MLIVISKQVPSLDGMPEPKKVENFLTLTLRGTLREIGLAPDAGFPKTGHTDTDIEGLGRNAWKNSQWTNSERGSIISRSAARVCKRIAGTF
jgi:hypothetical protein